MPGVVIAANVPSKKYIASFDHHFAAFEILDDVSLLVDDLILGCFWQLGLETFENEAGLKFEVNVALVSKHEADVFEWLAI